MSTASVAEVGETEEVISAGAIARKGTVKIEREVLIAMNLRV
jgi:hypothetical protein